MTDPVTGGQKDNGTIYNIQVLAHAAASRSWGAVILLDPAGHDVGDTQWQAVTISMAPVHRGFTGCPTSVPFLAERLLDVRHRRDRNVDLSGRLEKDCRDDIDNRLPLFCR